MVARNGDVQDEDPKTQRPENRVIAEDFDQEMLRYVAAATAQVRQMAAMSPPFTPVTEEATERGAEREGEIRKDLFAVGAPGLRGDSERESEGRWDSSVGKTAEIAGGSTAPGERAARVRAWHRVY